MEVMYIDVEEKEEGIFTIECDPDMPIIDLEKRIKKSHHIPEYCQKLYFNEIELLDNKKFSDYNIKATNGKYYEGRSRLNILNLNKLKAYIYIKNRKFDYFIKASDSIFNLKEIIFKNLHIPIDKMEVINSNKIISNNQLIEDFILDLNFEIKLLETDKIKINVINENKIETILVDPFSYTNDIFNKLNKDYDFRFKFKDQYIYAGKFIFEYNLKNGDTIELINDKSNKIKLIVRTSRKTQIITVYPQEPLKIIMDILNLSDKTIKMVYKGITYSIDSILTFEKIGLTKDTNIFLFNEAVSGCERMILLN